MTNLKTQITLTRNKNLNFYISKNCALQDLAQLSKTDYIQKKNVNKIKFAKNCKQRSDLLQPAGPKEINALQS